MKITKLEKKLIKKINKKENNIFFYNLNPLQIDIIFYIYFIYFIYYDLCLFYLLYLIYDLIWYIMEDCVEIC